MEWDMGCRTSFSVNSPPLAEAGGSVVDIPPLGVDDAAVAVALEGPGGADHGVDAADAGDEKGDAQIDHQGRGPLKGVQDQEEALAAALNVTGLTAADYDAVGYGYIMGSSEQNGTWQVFFVKGNEVISTVNLDARDATILLVEPDEEGNG